MIPYIYSITEVRTRLGPLVTALAAGDHGPVILGQHSAPAAVLASWELFDQMRDLLADAELLAAAGDLDARLTHPAGPTTTDLARLIPGASSTTPVTFWPDVVADLRGASPAAELVDALDAVADGVLGGRPLGAFHAFLVIATTATDPARGWHIVWREVDHGREVVAVLPISATLTRAWQPAPDLEAHG